MAVKRNWKKKVHRKKKRSVMIRNPVMLTGFPKERIVKLRYCDRFASDLTTGIATQTYRANSIFDPDSSGTGHQPLGHDQWATFYNHYVVLSAKITVDTSLNQNVNGVPVLKLVYLTDDTTSSLAPFTLAEQGKCNYAMLNGFASIGHHRTRNNYSARKFFNVADVKDNVTRIGADFGANPADQAFWICQLGTSTGAGVAITYESIVTIEYIVLMSEPKELTGS